MSNAKVNPYMVMPLAQVRRDALHGVRLARQAWRIWDPKSALPELERIIGPGQAERSSRISGATGDFLEHCRGSKVRRWKQR